MTLEQKIEAVLFWKSEPMSRKKLCEILGVKPVELNESLEKLKSNLAGRGVVLQEREDDLLLGTSPEVGKLIEDLQKEELNKNLSKASLETLSIILYKRNLSSKLLISPLSSSLRSIPGRSDFDFINIKVAAITIKPETSFGSVCPKFFTYFK